MVIPWLAEVLRAAGLDVVEVQGWRGHRVPLYWAPRGGIVHATADGAARNPVAEVADDTGAVRVIRNGRVDLPGPIANAYQARDGRWWVISDGRCNTALVGTAGPLRGIGNESLLGIEHENDNRGEPWPAIQYESAVRGWAAICRRLGWSADQLAGHKEHDPYRKSDPKGIDMVRFRRDVAAQLKADAQAPADKGDDMPNAIDVWDADTIPRPEWWDDKAAGKDITARWALGLLLNEAHEAKVNSARALVEQAKTSAAVAALLKSQTGGQATLADIQGAISGLDEAVAARVVELVVPAILAELGDDLADLTPDQVAGAVQAAAQQVAGQVLAGQK